MVSKSKYKAGDIIVDKQNRVLKLLRLRDVGLYCGRVTDLWDALDFATQTVIEIWLDRKHS